MLLIIDNQSKFIKQFRNDFLNDQDFDFLFFDHDEQIILPKGTKLKGIILSGGKGNPYKPLNLTANYVALMTYNVPTIGFCLGHEIIGVGFGARIKKLTKYQKKKEPVYIDKKSDPIFAGIEQDRLMLQEKHSYELTHVPDVFETLAHSAVCKHEIIKLKHRPVYGFQSHPEVSGTDGMLLINNFLKMCGLIE